jgi:hypothetical protein
MRSLSIDTFGQLSPGHGNRAQIDFGLNVFGAIRFSLSFRC